MPDYSEYQKGIIKRFYEHRDTIALQKLAETVSNLYLEDSETKKKRAWASARKQMIAAGVHEARAEEICQKRDLDAVAKIVQAMT